MSIALLIPALLFFLLLVPQVRAGFAWVLTLAIAPILIRSRFRFSDNFRPTPVQEERPSPLPAGRLSELKELGFAHRGAWIYDKLDGVSTTRSELFTHEELSMIAVVSQTGTRAATQRVHTQVLRPAEGRSISVSDASLAGLENAIERMEERFELPSLSKPAWLVQVLQTKLESVGNLPRQPLPQSTEEWTDRMSREHQRLLSCMRETGLITRSNRRGISRFTLPACLHLPLLHLWPWKQRRHEQSLAKERALLEQLGLTRLLDEAQRSPESAANTQRANPAIGVSIPDDRGTPRRIAQARDLKSDERRVDPRFVAIISQSQRARQGQFRRLSGWIIAAGMVAVILSRAFVQIPLSVLIFCGIFGMILIGVFMNAGRAFAAERAAADRLIRRGLCPSCLYGLEGLQADDDGCLVCPECGGAWNRSRVHEFAAFSNADELDPALHTQVARAAAAVGFRGMFFNHGSRTRDAKDKEVELVSPRLNDEIAALAPGMQGDLRERLVAARRAIGRSGRIFRWTVGSTILVLFVVFPGIVFFNLVLFSPSGAGLPGMFMVIPLLIGVMLTLGVFRGNFAYRRSAIVRAMLASRLCPACAEDLSARTSSPDGCVECVCGAAWRIAPPTAPPVLTPPAAPPPRSPAPSSSCTASSG
jgi:hypothetical protein